MYTNHNYYSWYLHNAKLPYLAGTQNQAILFVTYAMLNIIFGMNAMLNIIFGMTSMQNHCMWHEPKAKQTSVQEINAKSSYLARIQ